MIRPRVITHSLASLDGRLTLAPDVLLLYGDARWDAAAGSSEDTYRRFFAETHPQATLEGIGSFILDGAPIEPLPPIDGDGIGLYDDYLPPEIVNAPGRRWFTVVDSRGRGRWIYKEYPEEMWAGFYLLVLVSRSTPAEYLAYLRRETIPYLVAGDGRVN